jgi:hypothetical protein
MTHISCHHSIVRLTAVHVPSTRTAGTSSTRSSWYLGFRSQVQVPGSSCVGSNKNFRAFKEYFGPVPLFHHGFTKRGKTAIDSPEYRSKLLDPLQRTGSTTVLDFRPYRIWYHPNGCKKMVSNTFPFSTCPLLEFDINTYMQYMFLDFK